MQANELKLMIDYNYWANQRVLAAAAAVTPEELTAPAGLSHGSLLGALVHIYAAEYVWRKRCQEGVSPPALPTEADFKTLNELRQAWTQEEAAMLAFLAGLDDQQPAAAVQYTTTSGKTFQTILWQILVHVVNHGTQFRSEAAIRLTALGHSPGDLDLILYLRQ